MAVQGSGKLKCTFRGRPFHLVRCTPSSAKTTCHSEVRKPVSYDDPDYDDDLPLSVRLSRMSNLGTPSSNSAVPVMSNLGTPSSNSAVPIKKRLTTTTMPLAVKRPFDDNSSLLNNSVKKSKVAVHDHQDQDKDDTPLSRRTEIPVDGSADKSFSSLKKELELVEKSFKKYKRKKQKEKKKLESIRRDIEDSKRKRQEEKKLESMHKVNEKELSCVERNNETHKKVEEKNGERVTDYLVKEAQVGLMDELIRERKQELKENETKLRQVMDNIDKVRERTEECTVELENKESELDAMKKQVDEQAERLMSEKKALLKIMQISKNDQRSQMKEFESTKKQFEEEVKELESEKMQFEEEVKKLESEKKQFEGELKELRSKEKLLGDQVKEFKSMEDEFDRQVKEFESKEEELKAQMKKLRSKEKLLEDKEKELRLMENEYEGRIKELDSKEKQLEIREKEVESENKQLEGRKKKFDSKEKQLEIREKKVESEKKQLEGRIEEFDSEERQLKIQVMELASEKMQFEGKLKELRSKEEEFKARMQELKCFVSQMEDLESEGNHFEGQGKELESKDEKFKVHVKESKSKEKQLEFDGHMNDLESKPIKFDGLKRSCSSEKQYDALIELFDEETELVTPDSGNQSSPTSEQNDEFELADSDTLVNLQGASDPSKLVLEIIQHPTIENCKMGDNDVIIGDKHILLLEQLMRISPHIEPDVREEALKLALDLKANVEENNENYVPVLGFLLLLSIYGLVPSFDDDDILKFFGLVSQHNIAIELFRAMGFADKVSDFVDDLIKRQQYVEAVRFSCAFSFSDNNQHVDLLREHVRNAKLISESSCNKTNSIEIKDKTRDQEIASLETVQQCLSDNNLEFDDLLNEIDDRILELRSQKGK